MRKSPLATFVVIVATVLTGCSAPSGGNETVSPTPRAARVAGDTVTATAPQSPPDLSGWNVTLVTPSQDSGAARLASGVRDAIRVSGGTVAEVVAASGLDGVRTAVDEAVGQRPDVIVGVGENTVDVLTIVTAGLLNQQFLVVGAQLAEPTENVTSVVWPGATSRGSNEPPDGALSPDALTSENAYAATQAGFDSILSDTTGVVIHLEGAATTG